MCGIFCFVTSLACGINPCDGYKECKTRALSRRRGPNRSSSFSYATQNWHFYCEAHVLWMQGNKPVDQPSVDVFGNALLWNGDIFGGIYKKDSEDTGDTAALLKALVLNGSSVSSICATFSQVNGPWSVIYWNQSKKTLWFGRDALGRHSLLWCKRSSDIILTSVAERSHVDEFVEVPAVGIFSLDFSCCSSPDSFPVPTLHPWSHLIPELPLINGSCFDKFSGNDDFGTLKFTIASEVIKSPIDLGSDLKEELESCNNLPPESFATLPCIEALGVLQNLWDGVECRLDIFINLLKDSVKTRVQTQPGLCKICIRDVSEVKASGACCPHPKICVLFSGGIDSTVLALLADLFVPKNEAIDLLNVAFAPEKRGAEEFAGQEETFEDPNEEVGAPQKNRKIKSSKGKNSTKRLRGHGFSDVPDRITGKQALEELRSLCPTRTWNFVEIDVSVAELSKVRQEVISDLIHPLNTVLDDSLGCAMWFAARGSGFITFQGEIDNEGISSIKETYTSPARVAILGNGADEQLGGYSRHRSALEDGAWPSLNAEISRQVKNLPSRNLGRDDRICSDHGRQPRFPFLDEAIVSYLSSLAPWEKVAANVLASKKRSTTGSGSAPLTIRPGVGDKALLRLAALKLGLKKVCTFPKRAMQFGSRVAKLEGTGKEKASDVCERLKCTE